jgi:foldase protein PrsA
VRRTSKSFSARTSVGRSMGTFVDHRAKCSARNPIARSAAVIVTVLTAVLPIASLSACGSGANAPALEIAGSPISKAQIEHWMLIEAVVSFRTIPKTPQPKGVLPDPPSYSACIAWLRSPIEELTAGQKQMSAAQLKKACEQRLAALKDKAETILMVYEWERQQAAAEGITISQGEVEKDLRRFRRIQTPGKDEFAHYLKYAKMNLADAQFIQRITITGTKVLEAIEKKKEPQKAFEAFTSRWVAKTDCKPGYVVPGCRQYKGPAPPP